MLTAPPHSAMLSKMSKGGSLAPLAEIRLAFGLETPAQIISLYEIEFLILAEKEIRAAEIPADRAIPTLEQVIHVVETTSSHTAIEKRNRALFAFIASTGTRYAAAVTLRLKHFDPRPESCDPEPEGGQNQFQQADLRLSLASR